MLTITDINTGQTVQAELEDAAETLTVWFEGMDETIRRLQAALDAGQPTAGLEAELGIRIETEPTIHEWPTPAQYNALITDEDYTRLTQAPIDEALALSGEIGRSTLLTRQAYTKRAAGTWALKAALTHDERAVRKAFREAHTIAHQRMIDERRDIATGQRLTGAALDALREVMGVKQAVLAHDLGINERTLRGWRTTGSAYGGPSAGVTDEMWTATREWLRQVHGLLETARQRGSVECPIFAPHDDPALVQAAILLTIEQGGRFNIDPHMCIHDQNRYECYQCTIDQVG